MINDIKGMFEVAGTDPGGEFDRHEPISSVMASASNAPTQR
ncbi:MAG TPA: hypothetical protein VEH27_12250 [Methylomirabilota bacterium]|nr:hypothetical protein [Methylomirabilota bacterium]